MNKHVKKYSVIIFIRFDSVFGEMNNAQIKTNNP